MAYIGNQLAQIAGTLNQFGASECEFNINFYATSTDTLAQVLAANYISDGQKRGLVLNSVVFVQTAAGFYQCEVSALQNTATGYGVTLVEMTSGTGTGVVPANTPVTATVGTTLSAAAIVSSLITRTGPTAAFTDTTDTAANIIAAMNSQVIGNSWTLRIINDTAFPETIAAGSGVTLSGQTVVPANSWAEFLMTYSAAGAVTMYGYLIGSNVVVPPTKYTTGALTAATLTAAQIAGAALTVLNNSGATPGTQTLPAASVLFAAIPNCAVGFSYILRLLNSQASGTETLAADAGATITVTGHTAIAANTGVDYLVTFTSATAATCQSIGTVVAP
jgi:hypothetical protein